MSDDRKRPERNDAPKGGASPQSYGSDRDGLRGTTGQTVEETPHRTSRHDEAFYEPSLDANRASASEAPARQNADPRPNRSPSRATGPDSLGGKKVPESNETRQSYFKRRDYD